MTTHEVLVKARNLIDRVGWVQGFHGSHAGGYCGEGAISCAGRGTPDGYFHGPELEAWEVLCGVVGGAVHNFNDQPGRTKEEVLAAFDEAIAATAPTPPFETLQAEAPDRAPEPVACP